jgi:hypothetical protein
MVVVVVQAVFAVVEVIVVALVLTVFVEKKGCKCSGNSSTLRCSGPRSE